MDSRVKSVRNSDSRLPCQDLATREPRRRSANDTPQCDRETDVEPHDRGRPRPDLATHRAVVAGHHPAFSGRRQARQRSELLRGLGLPVRTPEQLVELDERMSELGREARACAGLAGTTRADDDDADELRRQGA